MGDRSSGRRSATCARARLTGRSDQLTTHQTISISSGAAAAIGATVRQASAPAMRLRTCMSCATWITWNGVASE